MVWFDPDLPVLRIHLNNTGPTARLTARRYRARISGSLYPGIVFQNVPFDMINLDRFIYSSKQCKVQS